MTNKRHYISNELIHCIGRNKEQVEQYEILLKIIDTGWLTHPPHNPNISGNVRVDISAKLSKNEMYSPDVICFCDIPVDCLNIHIKKYSPFGISFDKKFIIKKGGTPVFYLPLENNIRVHKRLSTIQMVQMIKDNGVDSLYEIIPKSDYFERIVRDYEYLIKNIFIRKKIIDRSSDEFTTLCQVRWFLDHIFCFMKFFDHTLPNDHPENYYFEREWRIIGNLNFQKKDVKRILLPENFKDRFLEIYPEFKELVFVTT